MNVDQKQETTQHPDPPIGVLYSCKEGIGMTKTNCHTNPAKTGGAKHATPRNRTVHFAL